MRETRDKYVIWRSVQVDSHTVERILRLLYQHLLNLFHKCLYLMKMHVGSYNTYNIMGSSN